MPRPRRFARIIVVYVCSLVITVAMLVWWIIAVIPYHWAVLTGGLVLLGLLIVGLTFQLAHALGERNYSRRQEEFVSNITHEMKSPLAAIKLHAQTLEQIAPDDEQQSVHFILQSVARMETLVDNVLESSRLIARKTPHAAGADAAPAVLHELLRRGAADGRGPRAGLRRRGRHRRRRCWPATTGCAG